MAHLVSLGLEDISGGDIQKAILALRGGILPLSKRGSELIKKRIALRAHPDWIEAVESDRELRNQMYDTFAPTSNPHRFETKQGLSYRELLRRDIEDATKKTQLATTIQKMLRAQRISPQIGEIQWMDTLVHELFPRIVTGKTLDFEAVSEIQKAYQKDGNTQQKQRWDAFLKKFEAGDFVELQFQSVLQVYISELQASKEIANQDGANDGFHGEAEPSYTNWNTLTQGKRVSDEVLRTAVLSGYVMGEMKLSISQAELETILRTIRSKKLSLEGCIDYAKTSIPE